jgi:hypothetical protein
VSVGDHVRCQRAEPARGTWSRYAGRDGVVVVVNRVTPPGHDPPRFEIGVDLNGKGRASAWFLPNELVPVDIPHSAYKAADGEQSAKSDARSRRSVGDE